MIPLIACGIGLAVGITRVARQKKGGKKKKKLQYYNYTKYEVRYNKINKSITERTKGLF